MPDPRFTLTRRNAMMAAAGTAAAPLLAAGAARPSHAESHEDVQTTERPTHYRFEIGDLRVATILDGFSQLDGPHPIFGQDVEAEAVAALLQENFLPAERFENQYTPVVLETGDEVVVFDTGNADGRAPTTGQFRQRLSSIGRSPEDVTLVVITHGHGDHIGGLMTDGQPTFPNARYAIGQVEYDFWSSDRPAEMGAEGNAQLFQQNVVPLVEKTTFLKEGDQVVPGVTAVEAFGHTPGHMIFMLDSGGEQLLLWADTANHYVASVQRPDWHVRFDMDKEAAVQTRRRVLDMVASDRLAAAGYHMPFPALGHVERAGDGFRWVPVSYQLSL